MTRNIEEGTFIINYHGEILNSKNEWHKPNIIRTTVVQGGAEMVGGGTRSCQRDGASNTVHNENDSVRNVDQGPIDRSSTRSTRSQTIRIQGNYLIN